MTIINVNASAETGYDAVALEAFRTVPPSLWAAAGSIQPDLTQQQDATVTGHQAETYAGGAVVLSGWTTGIDAVSAALMHDNVMNEYVLDTGTASLTDWVVTYPTKRFYVASGTGTPAKLFQRNFNGAAGRVRRRRPALLRPRGAVAGRPAAGILAAASGQPEVRAVLRSEHRDVEQLEPVRVDELAEHQHGVPGRLGPAEPGRRRDFADPPPGLDDEPDVQRPAGCRFRDDDLLQRPDSGSCCERHAAQFLRSAYGASFKHKTTSLIQ